MRICHVKYCPYFKKKYKESGYDHLKCHLFPTCQTQRAKWEEWVQKVNVIGQFKAKKYAALCSSHFSADCYLPSGRLKKDALPTIIPVLSAETALKLGMVSRVEEFPALWRQIYSTSDTHANKENCIPLEPTRPALQYNATPAETLQFTNTLQDHSYCVADTFLSTDQTIRPDEHKQPAQGSELTVVEIEPIPSSSKASNTEPAQNFVTVTETEPVPSCSKASCTEPAQNFVTVIETEPVPSCSKASNTEPAQNFAIDNPKLSCTFDRSAKAPEEFRDSASVSQYNNILGTSASGHDNSLGASASGHDNSLGASVSGNDNSLTGGEGIDEVIEQGIDPASPATPHNVSRKRRRFIGDFSPNDFRTPKRARKSLSAIQEQQRSLQFRIRMLRQSVKRRDKRIESLQSLLQHLKDSTRMTLDAAKLIEDKFSGPVSAIFKRMLAGKRSGKYDATLRKFALTLNFHSPAAYKYVRDTFLGCLPHPSTLGKLYSKLNGKPGFTTESFNAIRVKVEAFSTQGKKLYLALSFDEMAIKKQLHYLNNGVVAGYVDDGSGAPFSDSAPIATNAWVFMAVAVNDSWKIPVGYFFIDSLQAVARSNIILRCLDFLDGTGAEVLSLTMDGHTTNLASVENLGAGFQPRFNWKPYFERPGTGKVIHVFLDAAHMVKLWRNVFGNEQLTLMDADGGKINFAYIKRLHELQENEGLVAGNKLKKRHINFQKEKMKVRLATQTLSRSVADALDTCREDYKLEGFQGSEPTVKFIRCADVAFDILNSSNLYAKGILKQPLRTSNYEEVKAKMNEVRQYIMGLKITSGQKGYSVSIIESNWKTGFVGFLCCMESIESLYYRLVETECLSFLPSYKFSQDHLEMFFGAIRSKNGFNNNPLTTSFSKAYTKLLVHAELKEKEGSNCWPVELISILNVSSKPCQSGKQVSPETVPLEHDYSRQLRRNIQLSPFVEDVVSYIAGFVSQKVRMVHGCDYCALALFSSDSRSRLRIADRLASSGNLNPSSCLDLGNNLDSSGSLASSCSLLKRKNRVGQPGVPVGLALPSNDVILVCRKAESEIRVCVDKSEFLTTNLNFHVSRTYKSIVESYPAIFSTLDDHISSQAPINNHKDTLIKLVIKKFILVRMTHDVRRLNDSFFKERIRSRNTKTVLFSHQ